MHGVRRHEKYSQRREEEEEGFREAKRYPTQAIQNKWATDTKRMAERKKEQGAEIRKKKRLVMSMLSVTSFVDSHRVSMTTVKSLWESDTKHSSSICSNLFIELI